MSELTCTVIIATRNRPEWLCKTLSSLSSTHVFSVVVVDQSDESFRARNQQILKEWPDLLYVESPLDGLPSARNRGLACGSEDVVIFFDDDVYVYEGCIAAHIEAYDDASVGAVAGRIAEASLKANREGVGNGMNRLGRMRTNLWGVEEHWVESVKGANMSFRRQVLEEVGSFDSSFRGTAYLEEVDMSERVRSAGLKIRFIPKAEVIHYAAPSGGVRVNSRDATESWRFQNTGYFLGKHRGVIDGGLGHAAFMAVAMKRVVEWRQPAAAPRLVRAMIAGWREGRRFRNSK